MSSEILAVSSTLRSRLPGTRLWTRIDQLRGSYRRPRRLKVPAQPRKKARPARDWGHRVSRRAAAMRPFSFSGRWATLLA